MKQQLIISLGREFGSGGHEIAKKISDKYGLAMYDHDFIKEVAKAKELSSKDLEEFDEIKRNRLLSRTVRGMNNSPEQNIAFMQFEFLKKKADAGESFVVVGRCSEAVLKQYPGMISIFVSGDEDVKLERIVKLYELSEKKAQKLMKDKDRARRLYHDSYCETKWGASNNYDICINSSKLGIEETFRILCEYIEARTAQS